jgi:replicative DNA helicase
MLSDLRESGSIEMDADIVSFLYRPEYYGIMQDERGNPTSGLAMFIIAKHRNGPLADIMLTFEHEKTKFTDYQSYMNYLKQ